jgi:hypothetical protein
LNAGAAEFPAICGKPVGAKCQRGASLDSGGSWVMHRQTAAVNAFKPPGNGPRGFNQIFDPDISCAGCSLLKFLKDLSYSEDRTGIPELYWVIKTEGSRKPSRWDRWDTRYYQLNNNCLFSTYFFAILNHASIY